MRMLLLGGTAEARALAKTLHPQVDIISSLAGRVPEPALPVGPVRIGGFGGVEGLRRWLQEERIDAVVDATHPFAATMTAHAAEVCGELRIPHLVLARPAWEAGAAVVVASDTEAAEVVTQKHYSRVFLTTGRSGVNAFADSDAWFLIRAVTEPDTAALPRRYRLVLARGPYHYDDEFALMREHRIDALVTKNSGGDMTRAKLDAAAALGIPVVMVARPQLPAGGAGGGGLAGGAPLGRRAGLAGQVVAFGISEQRIAGAGDAGPDGAHRATADRCGVGVGEPQQLGEQQGFPLFGGEAGDHRRHFNEVFESAGVATAVEHVFRIGGGGGARPRLGLADVIGHNAARDGQQPGSGGGASGKPFDGADCPQVSLLSQIIRGARIGQIGDKAPHVLLSGFDERLERSRIPACSCQSEFGNGLVVA